MNSNDVQSLNGVKTLLQEQLGERVSTSFDFDVGFYRGNKQVWMRSDNDVKKFLSILKEKPECDMVQLSSSPAYLSWKNFSQSSSPQLPCRLVCDPLTKTLVKSRNDSRNHRSLHRKGERGYW